jgi:hypothetical protein
LLGLFFDPDDGGNLFLQNVGGLSTDYMAVSQKIATSLGSAENS